MQSMQFDDANVVWKQRVQLALVAIIFAANGKIYGDKHRKEMAAVLEKTVNTAKQSQGLAFPYKWNFWKPCKAITAKLSGSYKSIKKIRIINRLGSLKVAGRQRTGTAKGEWVGKVSL